MANNYYKKPNTAYAEKGQSSAPKNDIAKLITQTSAWVREKVEKDDEVESRIDEYFNLCASKGELPIFETLSLFLGVDDETLKKWLVGDGCTTHRKNLLQLALTRMKSIEGKAMYDNLVPYVPSIWRSKQYFGYKEPDSKLTLNVGGSPLKELPTAEGIAAAYLNDIAESEDD